MGRILPGFAYHFINFEQYYSCLLKPFLVVEFVREDSRISLVYVNL